MKDKREKLRKWFFDNNRNVFFKDIGQSLYKVLTYEKYEMYRGRYNKPTDKLLDSIFELFII
jgi:hypothetical protein